MAACGSLGVGCRQGLGVWREALGRMLTVPLSRRLAAGGTG